MKQSMVDEVCSEYLNYPEDERITFFVALEAFVLKAMKERRKSQLEFNEAYVKKVDYLDRVIRELETGLFDNQK
jgi:hypothetical protein